MTELIPTTIQLLIIEPFKFLVDHQSGTLTLILLGIALILFHRSGAGRYVYPWLLRTAGLLALWILTAVGRLLWRAVGAVARMGAVGVQSAFSEMRSIVTSQPKPQDQDRADRRVFSTSGSPVRIVASSTQPVPMPSTNNLDPLLIPALTSMGFSAAEAKAAADTPAVAAENDLNEQVRAALVELRAEAVR